MKPWDSPENLKLAEIALPFYSCPSHERPLGKEPITTSYLAVTGPRAAFPGVTPMECSHLKNGESNTILVIEHPSDVVWTEPRDLTLEEAANALASTNIENCAGHERETLFEVSYDQGRNVVFADGRVMMAPLGLDRTLATALSTINDGKPIEGWDLRNTGNVIVTRRKWGNVTLFWTCVVLALLPLPWVWIPPKGTKPETTTSHPESLPLSE